MDEGRPADEPPPLLVWCLSTFHAALLVSLLVGSLYLAGLAGDVLAGVGTTAGIASYLYLWGVTWWTNRRWLEDVGPAMAAGRPNLRRAAGEAMKWGGITGLLFLAGLLLVGGTLVIATSGPGAILFVALVGLVGAVASFVVGAAVGGLSAVLDVFLVRVVAIGLVDSGGEVLPPGS